MSDPCGSVRRPRLARGDERRRRRASGRPGPPRRRGRGTPRGRGTELLRAWMDRQAGQAGLHLEARRWFARGDTVVVDQLTEWREAGTGAVVERQEVGSVLVVRDGRVARFARHPDLGPALHAAGLGSADEVAPG